MPTPEEIVAAMQNAEGMLDGLRAIEKERAKRVAAQGMAKRLSWELENERERMANMVGLREQESNIIAPRPGSGKSAAHTAVVLLSDWHTHQIVRPEEVLGRNEHNGDIGIARGQKCFRDIAKLVKEDQVHRNVQDLVLWFGGDFMVGEIHGVESSRCCDLTPLEEARSCKALLTGGVEYLLSELDVDIAITCNWGNHGRTTEKKTFQRERGYSYEADMYLSIEEHFANHARVTIDAGDSAIKVTDIAGLRMVTHHGDIMRSGGGVGGLAVPFRKLINDRWAPLAPDLGVIGHFHVPNYIVGEGFTNGCLVGLDTYAWGCGLRESKPMQWYFLVDHSRREVGTTRPIWV